MKSSQVNILSGADTGSVTGSAIDVSQVYNASFQMVFGDATAAGTVKLQMSNDLQLGQPRNLFVPTNWSDITSATSTITSGVGAPILLQNMCFSYIRAIYTRSSGGSTTVAVNMNTLSA